MKTKNDSQVKGSASLYTTNKNSIVKDLLAFAKEMQGDQNNYPPATFSRYGFLVCLENGFMSDGNKKLERVLPEVDFSLNQTGGFSISLWFINKPASGGVHRFILKKGCNLEELTPSIGILPNGENLFVKVLTSRHKVETLFSSKAVEANRMYNLVATFALDHSNGLTDVSMYLDGLLDSQVR